MIGIETPARQSLVNSITAIDWNARARAALRRLSRVSGRLDADERYAEADGATIGFATSPPGIAGVTQTSSEQNSSPHKLSSCGGPAAARSDGSTGSLDPINGRTSPAGAVLEKEPSLDIGLGLVAQSRTNLVALEAQQGLPPLRTDSSTLPAAALAAAPRNLGVRRPLSGSQSAPAFVPAFVPGPAAAPDPDPRPPSRGSGKEGGDSGAVTGSRRQSCIEATLFPQPEPTPEAAPRPDGRDSARLPAPAADAIPLWKRIEAAERAAAAAADRAEAEAAGCLTTGGRRMPGGNVSRGQSPAAVAAPDGGDSVPRMEAARLSPTQQAAAMLQKVSSQHNRHQTTE